VIIGMALVFFYATLGGMKGITYTQVAQYVVLITAYLIRRSSFPCSSPVTPSRR
jgi:Na+(H+)/acetate symporter ActP